MAWIYHQKTGDFEHDGKRYTGSYAGRFPWKNFTQYESLQDKGPLPRGEYVIRPPVTLATTGLYSLPLVPAPRNMMYKRSNFLIHGANPAHPVDSSNGCIVASSQLRRMIWDSHDRILQVVP